MKTASPARAVERARSWNPFTMSSTSNTMMALDDCFLRIIVPEDSKSESYTRSRGSNESPRTSKSTRSSSSSRINDYSRCSRECESESSHVNYSDDFLTDYLESAGNSNYLELSGTKEKKLQKKNKKNDQPKGGKKLPPKKMQFQNTSFLSTQNNMISQKKDATAQRILSARLHKIKELKNELSDLQHKLAASNLENQLLKQLQYRHLKAIGKYENAENNLPDIIAKHYSEVRSLRGLLRKSQEQERNTSRKLREVEAELLKTKDALQVLQKLSEDTNLAERGELTHRLSILTERMEANDKRIQLPEANPVSHVVSRPSLRQSNGRQSFRTFFLCGCNTKASMEAAQLTLAIRSTLNTTRIIQQYMQHQNLAERYRASRRRQRGHVSDQDMDTDFSESMGPSNACIMVLMGQVHAVERRFWARETSTDWWDCIALQVWDDSQWLRNFCMRRGTFMELCDLLSPALKRMNTKMRAALTVEKRVAIAPWKLATPDSYRSVGNQFGVGKSTVGAAVMQVAHAIKDLLISRVVTLGNVQVIVDGFAAMGFPNCGGAIDRTHIPILAPEHQAGEYINRKGYFSVVLQALVDHKGRFTNINVGWPGKVHDARIFRNSGLFQKLQEGTLFPDQKITVGDLKMPICILGDPAYPLMSWLMKPYTGSLDSSQELFNYRLSKCRMVVECAFGRLKARWRSLLTRLDLSEINIPTVITACCALHNICESKGETFMAGWEVEANRLAAGYAQPDTRVVRRAQEGAVRIREAFMTGQATV
nr:lebercilin-like protein isoform X1 [Caretta caretta]